MNIPRRSPRCKQMSAALKIFFAACLIGCGGCLLLFPGSSRADSDVGGQFEGQAVADVRVVDSSGTPVTEKIPLLPLAPGKPFDFSAERESLRLLYRMGDYSDVRVSATREALGLRVDFVVERNFYNNVVRSDGLNTP